MYGVSLIQVYLAEAGDFQSKNKTTNVFFGSADKFVKDRKSVLIVRNNPDTLLV